jgi:hypothetical protein
MKGYNGAMDEPEPSRRPWLTHERTVLLVVALVVALGLIWLGWQAHIVRHRRVVRAQIEASGGSVGPFEDRLGIETVLLVPATRGSDIPTIRRLIGDEPVDLIGFSRELTAADREAIKAFPEARVWGWPETNAGAGAP